MGIATVLILLATIQSFAIVQDPDRMQVEKAVKKGIDFAQHHRPPNELYWHFGSTEKFKPRGFLVTKISGLAVMAGHYALRGEQPTDEDIQQVLDEEALQVVLTIFGNTPGFARDSYLLLKQGEQMIKPNRIRFDARAREAGYAQGNHVYRAKLVGLFSYEMMKLELPMTLLVFPGAGGEIHFELDLSAIP